MKGRGVFFFVLMILGYSGHATIGGHNSGDGPFTIDDAEDLDLTADSLGRDWISDFVGGIEGSFILEPMDLAGSALTPASGQSATGALRATIPNDGYGSINAGFGVPMPGEVGASTLVSPGDITSFRNLTFLACYEPSGLSNQTFQILLECYPQNNDESFPTLLWNYTPAEGTVFQAVSIDLFAPDTILNNPDGYTAVQLLTQTRFLYFYFFAGPVLPLVQLSFHIDDIVLSGEGFSHVSSWRFY